MKKLRVKLTYANVMATLGVFIALGGVSYAALKLPKNSVGTKQLRANAVDSEKVRDHSLKAIDFAADELPKGDPGPTGPQGPPGTTTESSSTQVVSKWSRKVAASAENSNPATARKDATPVSLFEDGPLSIYGKCFRDEDGNETFGETFVKTTMDHTIGDATVMGVHDGTGGGYINTTSAETALKVGESQVSSTFKSSYGDAFAPAGADTFAIHAPDGTAIMGWNVVGAKQESVEESDGPFGAGNVCLFDGYVFAVG
jgi:hypothetical protein